MKMKLYETIGKIHLQMTFLQKQYKNILLYSCRIFRVYCLERSKYITSQSLLELRLKREENHHDNMLIKLIINRIVIVRCLTVWNVNKLSMCFRDVRF